MHLLPEIIPYDQRKAPPGGPKPWAYMTGTRPLLMPLVPPIVPSVCDLKQAFATSPYLPRPHLLRLRHEPVQ
jgi:hypothetical protein